jgi:hypothetical protein
MAIKAGVSPEEQRLPTAIDKTIDEEHWSGEDECDPGELFEAITAVPTPDDRQGVKAAKARDDAQEGARDEQDQNTQVKTVDDNPARPKRCSKLTQRFGPDEYSPKEDGRDDYSPIDYKPIDNGQDDHSPSNYNPDDSDNNCMKSKPRTSTRRRRARGPT